MLDFRDECLEFKYNGKEHKLSYPTVGKLKKFQKKTKGNEDEIDALIEFLCDLGGDKEVIESLSIGAMTTLVEELSSGGKKK